MSLLTSLLAPASGTTTAGTLAARPAAGAGNAGLLYFATDVDGGTVYRSNGSSWVQVAASVTRPVTTAVKGTDETVTNSTATQNDDHLTVAVAASTTYRVDAFLIYTADATADLKIGWSAPAGSTFHWAPLSLNAAAGGFAAAPDFQYNTLVDQDSAGGLGTAVGNKVVARPHGLLIVGGTAGSLTLQWAQNTAHASDAKVYAGSYLRLERV